MPFGGSSRSSARARQRDGEKEKDGMRRTRAEFGSRRFHLLPPTAKSLPRMARNQVRVARLEATYVEALMIRFGNRTVVRLAPFALLLLGSSTVLAQDTGGAGAQPGTP